MAFMREASEGGQPLSGCLGVGVFFASQGFKFLCKEFMDFII